jgi:hypothetical protein
VDVERLAEVIRLAFPNATAVTVVDGYSRTSIAALTAVRAVCLGG